MPMTPTIFISKIIAKDSNRTFTTFGVNITYSGDLFFEITANSEDASPTWTEVPLISGVNMAGTFTVSGSSIQYRIIGIPGTVITGPIIIEYS